MIGSQNGRFTIRTLAKHYASVTVIAMDCEGSGFGMLGG